jgi:hypothetical protein
MGIRERMLGPGSSLQRNLDTRVGRLQLIVGKLAQFAKLYEEADDNFDQIDQLVVDEIQMLVGGDRKWLEETSLLLKEKFNRLSGGTE